MIKKRLSPFAIATTLCCVGLFGVGIVFGMQKETDESETAPAIEVSDSTPLIKRINVIPPKFGHAPVRAETVEMAEDVVRRLPPKIVSLLEKGGARIFLAPNIEDNWPGSGDGKRPGPIDMTMGEEGGRCYGRDVWLYEAEKKRGSQELKEPRSQEEMRTSLYQLLGHAINDCMGVVTKKAELVSAYKEDVKAMPFTARMDHIDSTDDNESSMALGCSEIIGVLIGGDGHHGAFPVETSFPRTTALLKKELMID